MGLVKVVDTEVNALECRCHRVGQPVIPKTSGRLCPQLKHNGILDDLDVLVRARIDKVRFGWISLVEGNWSPQYISIQPLRPL